MCWFHMIKIIEKKLKNVTNNIQIKNDIHWLQLSESDKRFNEAYSLFKKKWSSKNDKSINEFLDYFDKQWIKTLPGWYEGYAPGLPSTNNALQSFNSKIKKEVTKYERLSLEQFLSIFVDKFIVWSSKLISENFDHPRFFKHDFIIELSTWLEAFNLHASKEIKIIEKMSKNDSIYFIPTKSFDEKDGNLDYLILKYREMLKNSSFLNFDEYVYYKKKIRIIIFDKFNWQSSKCDCSNYHKNYHCKHILAIAMRHKLCESPFLDKNISIVSNLKRGRTADDTTGCLKKQKKL
jgi:hypothetical protein